jgi:hypothetical protein
MERDLLHDLFEQDFVGLLKAPKEESYGDICRKMQDAGDSNTSRQDDHQQRRL